MRSVRITVTIPREALVLARREMRAARKAGREATVASVIRKWIHAGAALSADSISAASDAGVLLAPSFWTDPDEET